MVFGLFKPKCPVCGMDVSENYVEKKGKRFCSRNCAKEHRVGKKSKGGSCH